MGSAIFRWHGRAIIAFAVFGQAFPGKDERLGRCCRLHPIVAGLAVAATLAGDRPTLDRLASSYGRAMAADPSGTVFRLMTGRPVTATADLPRAFDEMRTARDVRSALVPAPLPANFP